MKHLEWSKWEPRRIGRLGKKERSRNLEGKKWELSIVPGGVTNYAIGINAQVVVDGITLRIFLGHGRSFHINYNYHKEAYTYLYQCMINKVE